MRSLLNLTLLLPLWWGTWASAAESFLTGTPTGILGSSERLLSYRFQRVMWQAEGGAVLALVNLGDAGGLTLYTRRAPDAPWEVRFALGD